MVYPLLRPRNQWNFDMKAAELRAISNKLSTYLELHPDDKDARSIADRCGEIAALLEASSAYQRRRARELGSGSLEDRVLRIASGAPLSRREIRLAGTFALVWGSPWIFSGLSAPLTIGSGSENVKHGKEIGPSRRLRIATVANEI
jgi:hypothetical protein